jgi:hypothetical protein
MGLDDSRRAFDRDGLDHIGIERALHEEIDVGKTLRLFLEDGDELVPDALSFQLRIFDAGEMSIEALARMVMA